MTQEVFRKIMKSFNNRMIREKRHVLLLLDNAAVHESGLLLSNVKLQFLPPNTTSHTQPLDAGIIANFKNHYRNIQYKHVSLKYSALTKNSDDTNGQVHLPSTTTTLSNSSSSKPYYWITQLQAMNWIRVAWDKVESTTIQNSWRHTKLIKDQNAEEDLPSSNFVSNVELEDIEFNEEENQDIHELLDNNDGNVAQNPEEIVVEENEDENEDDESLAKQEDLLNSMRFIIENIVPLNDEEFEAMDKLSKMYASRREEMIANRVKQTSITKYFSK